MQKAGKKLETLRGKSLNLEVTEKRQLKALLSKTEQELEDLKNHFDCLQK
jgi:hypothetical protein